MVEWWRHMTMTSIDKAACHDATRYDAQRSLVSHRCLFTRIIISLAPSNRTSVTPTRALKHRLINDASDKFSWVIKSSKQTKTSALSLRRVRLSDKTRKLSSNGQEIKWKISFSTPSMLSKVVFEVLQQLPLNSSTLLHLTSQVGTSKRGQVHARN